MARSIATWMGIAAVCATILFIPVAKGAIEAARDAYSGGIFLDLPGKLGAGSPARDANDKDCVGYFETREQAQRFFLEHGGPKKDPHHLDRDGDGAACEEFDY